jgi:hypothetical protein
MKVQMYGYTPNLLKHPTVKHAYNCAHHLAYHSKFLYLAHVVKPDVKPGGCRARRQDLSGEMAPDHDYDMSAASRDHHQ